MDELWKPCPDYEDTHMISDKGRVKIVSKKCVAPNGGIYLIKDRVLKQKISGFWVLGYTDKSK